jgi:TorA maturation chaperone TorD
MSNETKQTAVEQFAIALYEGGYLQGNGDEINDLLEHHKEMHKEEIEDAFQAGKWDWAEHIVNDVESKDASQFYNETYGGNK